MPKIIHVRSQTMTIDKIGGTSNIQQKSNIKYNEKVSKMGSDRIEISNESRLALQNEKLVNIINEAPDVFQAELVDINDQYGPFGAKSISEIACNGAAPAIAMAIADATGAWVRSWPITGEKVLRALGRF